MTYQPPPGSVPGFVNPPPTYDENHANWRRQQEQQTARVFQESGTPRADPPIRQSDARDWQEQVARAKSDPEFLEQLVEERDDLITKRQKVIDARDDCIQQMRALDEAWRAENRRRHPIFFWRKVDPQALKPASGEGAALAASSADLTQSAARLETREKMLNLIIDAATR